MNERFSQGPWTIERDGGDRHLRSADGTSLMCDMRYYPWTPTSDADWQLISAVTDLYEALKAAIPEVEYKIDHSQTAKGRWNAARTLEQIKAALDKAVKQ